MYRYHCGAHHAFLDENKKTYNYSTIWCRAGHKRGEKRRVWSKTNLDPCIREKN